MKVAKEERKQ